MPAPEPVLLGEPVPYADGSEDELLAVVEAAGDRSTASDELASAIHDWPTRYHLSRLRANLLRPLRVGPGMRVLDIGAGTGTLARYLGETGAGVLAVEGSLARARVAARRCHDLPNVEVAVGQPHDVAETGFDLVLCIGVLEYAGATHGGGRGPVGFLDELRRLVAPDGALVLAIENQLGLKYLVGYPEDHLARPWVGVEGYPGPPGVRTWSRLVLRRMLAGTGLREQRWLFPFPDYKLPTAVLAEEAYLRPDATDVVDQLVGHPVRDWAHEGTLAVDERRSHRTFLDAGLGPDVANSFLVVASQAGADPGRFLDTDAVAHVYGNERLRRHLRETVVRRQGDGLTVETTPLAPSDEPGWLRQQTPAGRRPWVAGRTLEQMLSDACARHDLDAAASVLRTWDAELSAVEAPGPQEPSHPFLPGGGRPVLPPDHLDVELSNFVAAQDGLAYVDREWVAEGGVDAGLARARALWYFAHKLVAHGAEHPFGDGATADDVAARLGEMCGADTSVPWKDAEAHLQHLVTGVDLDEARRHYGVEPDLRRSPPRPSSIVRPLRRLRRR